MGNYLTIEPGYSGGRGRPLLESYKNTPIAHINESYDNLIDVHGSEKYNVDEEEFDEIFGFWIDDTEMDFKFWSAPDTKVKSKSKQPREVNIFYCFSGMTAFCKGTLESKLKFIFHLFDFDNSKVLSSSELEMLMRCVLKGLCKLTGLPLDLKKENKAIKNLVEEVHYQMDDNMDSKISLDEFIGYALKNRKILTFLHNFIDETDFKKAINMHKKRYMLAAKEFDEIAEDNLAPLKGCMEILKRLVKQVELKPDEVVQLTELIDCQGKVSKQAFEELGKGLIAFDIIDVPKNNFVFLVDLRHLVHVKVGTLPDPTLLAEVAEKMGHHNDDDDLISRSEWIDFCSLPRELDQGYYETFSKTVKDLFDKHDTNKSGRLEFHEFERVLYDSLLSVTPGSLRDLIDKHHWVFAPDFKRYPKMIEEDLEAAFLQDKSRYHFTKQDVDYEVIFSRTEGQMHVQRALVDSGKTIEVRRRDSTQFLVNMSRSLSCEMFNLVGVSKKGSVEWLKLKIHLAHLWNRKNEVMKWMFDHQTDHFCRLFTSDHDDDGLLSVEELAAVMYETLKPSIHYSIITDEQAKEIAHSYSVKILDTIDTDGDRLITEEELKANLDACVNMEREMLDSVEKIRADKIASSIKDRQDHAHKVIAQAQQEAEKERSVPPASDGVAEVKKSRTKTSGLKKKTDAAKKKPKKDGAKKDGAKKKTAAKK